MLEAIAISTGTNSQSKVIRALIVSTYQEVTKQSTTQQRLSKQTKGARLLKPDSAGVVILSDESRVRIH